MSAAAARRFGHTARSGMGAGEHRRRSAAALVALDALAELSGPGRLATYAATASEIDPAPLESAWRRRRWELHLPRIDAGPRDTPTMHFAPWPHGLTLVPNRFGIEEPAAGHTAPGELDVVIVPCVAADHGGVRVGFGAGYYDRALASTASTSTASTSTASTSTARPLLVGLAFEVQCVREIEAREWDIPLDVLVTDAGVRRFDSPGRREPVPVPDAGDDAPAR